MKKIGALIPVWNQELFIRQHLTMLSGLDKIVVMLQPGPIKSYQDEYNVGMVKDCTEDIVKSFPNVEWHEARPHERFLADLFNEGLPYVRDCDMVLKFDPDCFFTQKDWLTLIDHIHAHDHDCYRLNCKTNSVNYYVPGRFDFGVRDGGELDEVYAFNPSKELHGVTSYDASNPCLIDASWGDFTMHHFKGWKKSFTPEWANTVSDRPMHPNFESAFRAAGGWITAPQEIIERLQ